MAKISPHRPGAVSPATSYETGRYIITAHLVGKAYSEQQRKPRQFISLLQVDEYGGWLKFHCTYATGAMGLEIQQRAVEWVCNQPCWAIDSVQMVSIEQYILELEKMRVHSQK